MSLDCFVSSNVPRDLRRSEARHELVRKTGVIKNLERSQVLQDLPLVQDHKLATVRLQCDKGKGTAPGGEAENKLAVKLMGDHWPTHIPVAWKKKDRKQPGSFQDL